MKIKIMMTNQQEIVGVIQDEQFSEFMKRLKNKWLTIGNISIRQENISYITKIEEESPKENK